MTWEKTSNGCSIVQYADDTRIFSSEIARKKVEDAVNNLFRYFDDNHLKLNCVKTVCFLQNTSSKETKDCSVAIIKNYIKNSSYVKYLGIYLDLT